MRLIDADAMKYKLCHVLLSPVLRVMVENAIDDAPTVDADPVKHGRWIENRTDLICSACRWIYSDELRFMSHHGLDAVEEAFAYCPHCGAEME